MSSKKNANNATEPQTLSFLGLTLNLTQKIDYKDIIARLFLCSRFTCEHVQRFVSELQEGRLNSRAIVRFKEVTDKELGELHSEPLHDYQELMKSKYSVWVKMFGIPAENDFAYLEKKFGFRFKDLFGMEEICRQVESAEHLAEMLKKSVIGQDKAIETIAVPVYQHMLSKERGEKSPMSNSVVLMGPTGVGKSEILRLIGEYCDCPVIRINSCDVSGVGWKGLSIPQLLGQEMRERNYTIEQMSHAILIFHEFDKVPHHNSKIVGESGTDYDNDLMRNIMRFFEKGHNIILDNGNNFMSGDNEKLPTDNLLVVFDGAFVGMDSLVLKRLKSMGLSDLEGLPVEVGTPYGQARKSIGFGKGVQDKHPLGDGQISEKYCANYSNIMKYVNELDLIEWGFMPELVGRIGQICVLDPLSPTSIKKIMLDVEGSALHKHIEYFKKQYNADLVVTDEALNMLAEKASVSGLGCRYVVTLLCKCLNPVYYRIRKTKETQIIKLDEQCISKYLDAVSYARG